MEGVKSLERIFDDKFTLKNEQLIYLTEHVISHCVYFESLMCDSDFAVEICTSSTQFSYLPLGAEDKATYFWYTEVRWCAWART